MFLLQDSNFSAARSSQTKEFSPIDYVESLSMAMDLISPEIYDHHRRVAYISWQIARELALPERDRNNIVLAALMHDCGAVSMPNRLLTLLHFELNDTDDPNLLRHAETGYMLLKKFRPFREIARIVRIHHHPWCSLNGRTPEATAIGGNIIHVADRLDVLVKKSANPLLFRAEIVAQIKQNSGSLFKPDLVEAIDGLARKESFWLDIANISMFHSLGSFMDIGKNLPDCESMDSLQELTQVFGNIIDFRCSFTASHSTVVAAMSGALARLAGFSDDECIMMEVAGHLHDLGKLAIPVEIIHKPTALSKEEFAVIQSHSYYTFKVFSKFRNMDRIRRWAAFHHERLDGTGYPFKVCGDDLDLGSRIVAVADVYTALSEDRPYRKGLAAEETLAILKKMTGGALDGKVIDLLEENYPDLHRITTIARSETQRQYEEFRHILD